MLSGGEQDRLKGTHPMRRWKRILTAGFVAFALLLIGVWYAVTQPLFGTTGSLATVPPADTSKLQRHVEALVDNFSPRDWEHPKNLERAADYIREQLTSAGASVDVQTYKMMGKDYHNVIGLFGPPKTERVIVGAHYDAAEAFPGADDNASGLAALLELARILGEAPVPGSIELVAYTLEEPKDPGEPGLFRSSFGGSTNHVRTLLERGVSVKAAIVLDMIGYYSDEEGSQELPSVLMRPFYPSRGNFIAILGRTDQGHVVRQIKAAMRTGSRLPVYSVSLPYSMVDLVGLDKSDHLNYWKAGIPAVHITDTAYMRNKQYHKEGDTVDNLDFARMGMVVESLYAAVRTLAQPAE